MDADPARSVRTHEGLVAGPGGRGRARRQGVGHGQRRQHRRHDGAARCCAWAASRAWPARPSPRRSRARAPTRPPSCSTPAPTPSASPSGSCSSPRWAPSTPASATASPRRRSACCRSARSPARATRWSRRPTPSWPTRRGSATTRRHVRRQRRGPRPHVARGRRRRHRRVHRQRGPQDARGRHAGPGRTPSSAPSAPTTSTQAAADTLMPALLPLYATARPRQHRRRHAARRGRSVHHQPRIVVGRRRWSTPSGSPPSMVAGDLVGAPPGRDRVA